MKKILVVTLAIFGFVFSSNTVLAQQQDSIICHCGEGDLNDDGVVNIIDMLSFFSLFGNTYDCSEPVDTICDYGDADVTIVYSPISADTIDINNATPTFGVPVYSLTVTPSGGDVYMTKISVSNSGFFWAYGSDIDVISSGRHLFQDGVEISFTEGYMFDFESIESLVLNQGVPSTFTITLDFLPLSDWPVPALPCGTYLGCFEFSITHPEIFFKECDGANVPFPDRINGGGFQDVMLYFE